MAFYLVLPSLMMVSIFHRLQPFVCSRKCSVQIFFIHSYIYSCLYSFIELHENLHILDKAPLSLSHDFNILSHSHCLFHFLNDVFNYFNVLNFIKSSHCPVMDCAFCILCSLVQPGHVDSRFLEIL